MDTSEANDQFAAPSTIHGRGQTNEPIMSGLVSAYCTASAYNRRSLYNFLRRRYAKKRGKVLMQPDCICLLLNSDTLDQSETSRPTETMTTESTHLIANHFKGISGAENAMPASSYGSLLSTSTNGTRSSVYGEASSEQEWPELGTTPDIPPSQDTEIPKIIESQGLPHEVYFFDYGATVCWGLSKEIREIILAELRLFEIDPLPRTRIETNSFAVAVVPHASPTIHNGTITLNTLETNARLAISLPLSQSTKLGVQEDSLMQAADQYMRLAENLAEKGTVQLNRLESNKVIGQLYLHLSNINLSSPLLDLPDFFWEESDDASQEIYSALRQYLHMESRLAVVENKMDVLSSIGNHLKSELNADTMFRLDWLIIIVLAIDATLQLIVFGMKIVWGDEDIIA